MNWLSFVYPRSHSGWIGPIDQFDGADVGEQPAYRSSPFLPFGLHSIWKNRLAFLMPFRTSTMAWLDFCMFWLGFVYPRSHPGWIGPIGKIGVPGIIPKQAYRYSIILPLTWLQYEGIGLRFSVKSYQSDRVTWFLYELTEFCIPQVPFRLNWANWRIYRICFFS